MSVLAWCGVAVLLCILILVLKRYATDFAPLVTIGAGVMLFVASLALLAPVFSYLSALSAHYGLEEESKLLFKIFGISCVVEWASGVCRDLGEQSLSSQLELLGKAEVLTLLLPTLQKILTFSMELLP